jgi:hypothetical protein
VLVEGVASHFDGGCEGAIENWDGGEFESEASIEREQTQAACSESCSICLVNGVLSPACYCIDISSHKIDGNNQLISRIVIITPLAVDF